MKSIKCLVSAVLYVLMLGLCLPVLAQPISIYQFRHVSNEDMSQFMHRETTYWEKVAEKAVEDGNLQFWAVLVKVGGFDIPNSPNVLFINTFNDIDATGGIWDPSALFPDVPYESMDTFSMSKVMHTMFVRNQYYVEADGVNPDEDINYVNMIFHDTNSPGALIDLEIEHWGSFIESSMNENKTPQKGWGNAVILSPSGPDIKATTISYDLYSTLKDALAPTWAEGTVFPDEGLDQIEELEINRRISNIYQIVTVVSADMDN
ncbi:hypothetical protein [Rhodohalobacter sulfatireducens]|uniref:Uncharacterized protein n=1 Tax=Rhodohalobacter sulfatireducens TaxID=2911366 RepID=A0ABS9KGC9_9BACT|nr:hypothetical protein [Rhodohalobacter sulfatireducens]MCG2589887.1 hypothetical protein [Rhodohalobacter sulfatireducens]